MTDYRDRIATVFFTTLPAFPQAECLTANDPDLFFPQPNDKTTAAEAKEFCRFCYHQVECLEYALDHQITDGIFGGFTPDERASLKPRRDRRKKKPLNYGGAA